MTLHMFVGSGCAEAGYKSNMVEGMISLLKSLKGPKLVVTAGREWREDPPCMLEPKLKFESMSKLMTVEGFAEVKLFIIQDNPGGTKDDGLGQSWSGSVVNYFERDGFTDTDYVKNIPMDPPFQFIRTRPLFCCYDDDFPNAHPCPHAVNSTLVRKDDNHLTAAFAIALAEPVSNLLVNAYRGQG